MAYAILVSARPGDVARFERRGVKVVNLPGAKEKYGLILAEAFAELREYRRENAGPTLKPTDEKPLEQLMLPRDASSRLCLFATPIDVLPFYKENIFPLAEAVGLVPITAADVINLGDSTSAKIDTLIDRSAVIVVDATSPYTQFELGLAASRAQEVSNKPNRQPLHIISIITEYAQTSNIKFQANFIVRPYSLTEDSQFILDIGQALEAIAGKLGLSQNLEPRRLYEAKEYRAAVISAMTSLESMLGQRLDRTNWRPGQRPMSLRRLLERASEENILQVPYEEVLRWTKLRNDAVHMAAQINRNDAKIVVEGVERILRVA